MAPIAVLFDIDHTLVSGTYSHKKAFARAFEEFFSVRISLDEMRREYLTAGMTDTQIIYSVLTSKGIARKDIDEKIEDIREMVASLMVDNLNEAMVVPLAGVRELLFALKGAGVRLGLVTGNIERIAHAKLNKISIDDFFEGGSFGNESEKRSELVKTAIFRMGLDAKKTFVVGDTPRDVSAAKTAGAFAIAVASGEFTREELKAENPYYVLQDLEDTAQFLKLIGAKYD